MSFANPPHGVVTGFPVRPHAGFDGALEFGVGSVDVDGIGILRVDLPPGDVQIGEAGHDGVEDLVAFLDEVEEGAPLGGSDLLSDQGLDLPGVPLVAGLLDRLLRIGEPLLHRIHLPALIGDGALKSGDGRIVRRPGDGFGRSIGRAHFGLLGRLVGFLRIHGISLRTR